MPQAPDDRLTVQSARETALMNRDERQQGDAHPAPTAKTLSEDLKSVLEHADGRAITIGEVVQVLGHRGMAVMLVILCIPFLVPIPTMGLSAPAGAAVALYGVAVALNVRPWLPGFIARRQISHASLERIVGTGVRLSARAERLLKPRLKFMTWPGINILIGISLIFLGFFMALPLPIPGTNSAPAFGILLLLLGLVERDGLFVLAGQVVALLLLGVSAVVVYFLVVYGWAGLEILRDRLFGGTDGAGATTRPAAAATAPGA